MSPGTSEIPALAFLFRPLCLKIRTASEITMMTARGTAIPMPLFAPVESPDGRGVFDTSEGVAAGVLADAAIPDVMVLLGMTRSLIVGRGAPPSMVHPLDVEVGQASGTSVGV